MTTLAFIACLVGLPNAPVTAAPQASTNYVVTLEIVVTHEGKTEGRFVREVHVAGDGTPARATLRAGWFSVETNLRKSGSSLSMGLGFEEQVAGDSYRFAIADLAPLPSKRRLIKPTLSPSGRYFQVTVTAAVTK